MNKHSPPATLIWLPTSREPSLASRTRFLAVAWDQSPPWSVLLFIVKHSFFNLIPEHPFISQDWVNDETDVSRQGYLPTLIQRKWIWPAVAFHIQNVLFSKKTFWWRQCTMFPLSNKSCFKSNKLRPILKFAMQFPKIFVLTWLDQSNQEKY